MRSSARYFWKNSESISTMMSRIVSFGESFSSLLLYLFRNQFCWHHAYVCNNSQILIRRWASTMECSAIKYHKISCFCIYFYVVTKWLFINVFLGNPISFYSGFHFFFFKIFGKVKMGLWNTYKASPTCTCIG